MLWRFRGCGLHQTILGCLLKEGTNVWVANVEGTLGIVTEVLSENFKRKDLSTVRRIILNLILARQSVIM